MKPTIIHFSDGSKLTITPTTPYLRHKDSLKVVKIEVGEGISGVSSTMPDDQEVEVILPNSVRTYFCAGTKTKTTLNKDIQIVATTTDSDVSNINDFINTESVVTLFNRTDVLDTLRMAIMPPICGTCKHRLFPYSIHICVSSEELKINKESLKVIVED